MAITWKKHDLPTLEDRKISTINEMCQKTIYAGINVELSYGTEHFSLDVHDQANIESMFTAVTLGAKEQQYHCDSGAIKTYPASDIVALYAAYKKFVTKHTTYCNLLKVWIKREESKEIISGIVYGCELPDDLKLQMQNVVESSTKQLQDIVMTVNNGAFADKITSLEDQMTETQLALCDVYEQIITVTGNEEE